MPCCWVYPRIFTIRYYVIMRKDCTYHSRHVYRLCRFTAEHSAQLSADLWRMGLTRIEWCRLRFSAAAMWFMAIAMTVYVRQSPSYQEYRLFRHFIGWHTRSILRIFKLGAPIAMALFCEVTLFTVVALLLARSARKLLPAPSGGA